MPQMSIRAQDELLHRVRTTAAGLGLSINEYVVRVLSAATDPDLAGTEVERLRDRLASVGLLEPAGHDRVSRPPHKQVAAARAAAGVGTPLADLVESGRG